MVQPEKGSAGETIEASGGRTGLESSPLGRAAL
jgi:hypothetical protein